MCDETNGRFIRIEQIDPASRARAFGDGLTAVDRFRRDISPHFPRETVERIVVDLLAKMEAKVAAGEMIPIIGPPGVMGWQPWGEVARMLTRTPAEREADLKRGEELATDSAKAARKRAHAKNRRPR